MMWPPKSLWTTGQHENEAALDLPKRYGIVECAIDKKQKLNKKYWRVLVNPRNNREGGVRNGERKLPVKSSVDKVKVQVQVTFGKAVATTKDYQLPADTGNYHPSYNYHTFLTSILV